MTDVQERVREDWDGVDIPVARFGKDHWSTFAYVETRCVDHGGKMDLRHLRGYNGDCSMYPTRLNDGVDLFNHDDGDCIADLVAAGLLDGWPNGRGDHYAMTPKGTVVAGKLRAHKSAGNNFATFDPGPVLSWWAAK